jgi:hypothetical protein
MTGKSSLAAALVVIVVLLGDVTHGHAAHFKLMPYPIYKDATSKELLVLGTQEARTVMQKVNEERRHGKEDAAVDRQDKGVTVTRRWTPRQIVKEKDSEKKANVPLRRNRQLRTKVDWTYEFIQARAHCLFKSIL